MIMQEIKQINGDAEYYASFLEMWKEYLADLKSKEPRVEDLDVSGLYQMFQNENLHIYFMMLNDKCMGFAIVGVKGEKPKGASAHIAEFFVRSEYRNKGFGRWMAREVLKNYGKTVSLHILRNNPDAKRFWERVFADWDDVSEKFDLSDEIVIGKVYRKHEE